jgi:hypothetical protein
LPSLTLVVARLAFASCPVAVLKPPASDMPLQQGGRHSLANGTWRLARHARVAREGQQAQRRLMHRAAGHPHLGSGSGDDPVTGGGGRPAIGLGICLRCGAGATQFAAVGAAPRAGAGVNVRACDRVLLQGWAHVGPGPVFASFRQLSG